MKNKSTLIEDIKAKDFIAVNINDDFYEYDLENDDCEYLGDELDSRVLSLQSKYYYTSAILNRFETIKWGGTSTYKTTPENFLVKIENLEDSYILLKDLDFDNIEDERVADTVLIPYGDNRDFSYTHEEGVISEVRLSEEEQKYYADYILKTNNNSSWENIVVWDENKIILNEEDLVDEIRRVNSRENEYYLSKEEMIERLENLGEYYGLRDACEFVKKCKEWAVD